MFVGPLSGPPGPGDGWVGKTMAWKLLCGPVAAALLILLYQEEHQRHRSETTAICAHSPTDPCLGVGLGVGRGSAGIRFSPTLDSPGPPLSVAPGPKGSGRDKSKALALAELKDPEEGQVWWSEQVCFGPIELKGL